MEETIRFVVAPSDFTFPIELPHDQVIDILAKYCVNWNLNKDYIVGSEVELMELIFEELFNNKKQKQKEKIILCAKGCSIDNLLQSFKKFGTNTPIEFKPSEDFIKDLQLKKEKYSFKTHVELDNFVLDLKAKNHTVKYGILFLFIFIYFYLFFNFFKKKTSEKICFVYFILIECFG
jgi:hypothetical protein